MLTVIAECRACEDRDDRWTNNCHASVSVEDENVCYTSPEKILELLKCVLQDDGLDSKWIEVDRIEN